MKTKPARNLPLVFCALILLIGWSGCTTMTPAEQQAYFDKTVKEDMQKADLQMIRPYAVASAKFGAVPESGDFSVWGDPGEIYFSDNLIVRMQLGLIGLKVSRMPIASIDPKEIREVQKAKSTDGYDALVLCMDDNIRYYTIPFMVAELTPFGEIKSTITWPSDSNDPSRSAAADYLYEKLAPRAHPRTADMPPQLIDKHPDQFVREEKVVEGILEHGENRVDIEGKAIVILLGLRPDLGVTMDPPWIGFKKWEPPKGFWSMSSSSTQVFPVSPSQLGFVVDGQAYTAKIVRTSSGQWRYRVEIPKPVM